MAIGGSVRSGPGGVTIAFQPPVEFILRQSGRFRHELDNLDGLWDRFKPLMSELEEEVFGSHGFGAWPALAESTQRQKAALGYPGDIMVRTGRLRESLINPGQAARTSAHEMEWGTSVDFAHWHQEGGSIEGRPPERELIPDPMPVGWRRRFEKATVDYVNDAARRTWGVI